MTTLTLTDPEALALGDLIAIGVALKFGDVDTALEALAKYLESPRPVIVGLFNQLDKLLKVPGAGIEGAR